VGVVAGQLLARVSTLSGWRAIVSAVRAWAARQPGDCWRTGERGDRTACDRPSAAHHTISDTPCAVST
jgi:hypothetical protein